MGKIMSDNRLKLTLASGRYDITFPLASGAVDVEGIKLNVLSNFSSVDVIFRRMLTKEFDASELSLSHYLITDQVDKRFVALPIFLNRVFPHGNLYVNVDSGIKHPSDLKGKKIGLPSYQVTRALWLRGILKDDYDIEMNDVHWITEQNERIPLGSRPGLKVTVIPPHESLMQLLVDGKIDAAMYWNKPHSDRVRYLFEDPKAESVNYFRRTRLFPMMHTVVIKRTIYEQNPWVARCLYEAYRKSKSIWYEWRKSQSNDGGSIAWIDSIIASQEQILGEDPFPFNLKDNRLALETLCRYSTADGFIRPVSDISSLFVDVSSS